MRIQEENAPMNAVLEMMWKTYSGTTELIQFSDTKAQVILAVNGIIVSVVFTNVAGVKNILLTGPIFSILFIGAFITLCFSIFFSLLCLIPTLHIGDSTSVIYFRAIAQRFGKPADYEQAATEVFSDDTQTIAQVASAIWATSRIARRKFYAVTWATWCLGLTILIASLAVLAILVSIA
jgi:hypothetical protein